MSDHSAVASSLHERKVVHMVGGAHEKGVVRKLGDWIEVGPKKILINLRHVVRIEPENDPTTSL